MSLDLGAADPFLLLAHHRHSFSPGDPFRGPFKTVGGALGLPYVGDEGFKLHPHRGIDIWTIVLDGSDGFCHTDSLGGKCTYRGGSSQFMRSGRGAMHEEMWETRPDKTTKIELFQLWVNLPGRLKMADPCIRYVGDEWHTPYTEEMQIDQGSQVATRVRTFGNEETLQRAEGQGEVLEARPPVEIRYANMPPGGSWVASAERGHTALFYVRSGSVRVRGPVEVSDEVHAGSTCSLGNDGDYCWLVNAGDSQADVLLLTGEPLREPVVLGGPIVMNTQKEVMQAYAELRDGTFLN